MAKRKFTATVTPNTLETMIEYILKSQAYKIKYVK
jgi:hypothetical protein